MRTVALLLCVAVLVTLACNGPRVGAALVAPAAPADRVMSIGVNQGASGPPQTAALVQLRFGAGTPTSEEVFAHKIPSAPKVDGDDADWAGIPASAIPLVGPAAAIGLSTEVWTSEYTAALGRVPTPDHRIDQVLVRSAWDDDSIYFLLQWRDDTEQRWREAWFLGDGGTFVRSTDGEDEAHLAFDLSFPEFQTAGCAAACHVRDHLGEFAPDGGGITLYRFRMHTHGPDERADVWSWRATTTGGVGLADNQTWDSQRRNADGPVAFSAANRKSAGGVPNYMGAEGINSNPDFIYLQDAGTPAAVPFDPAGAAPNARIPGYVHQPGSPERSNVRAVGRWASGWWTVEWSRARVNDSANDAQFPDVPRE